MHRTGRPSFPSLLRIGIVCCGLLATGILPCNGLIQFLSTELRRVLVDGEGYFEPERRANIQCAFNADGATHEFDKILANSGAQTGATIGP